MRSDGTKFLLDSARVTNAGLASAAARNTGTGWQVVLTFNPQGQPQWTALTAEAYENTGGVCVATAPRTSGGDGVCQVAFAVDNTVLTAPAIQGVITGPALMTGGNETEIRQLAGELTGGRLQLSPPHPGRRAGLTEAPPRRPGPRVDRRALTRASGTRATAVVIEMAEAFVALGCH